VTASHVEAEQDRLHGACDKALTEGKLWKAKEVLQGRIATSRFDPALYEKYGTVLLAMGDSVEAGKYLFLAGTNRPEDLSAKALYLARHARKWENLYATFPSGARLPELSEYPKAVADELRRLGYSEQEGGRLRAAHDLIEPKTFRGRLLDLLGASLALFIFLCFLVGAVVMVKTFVRWVS
jgi:hypothetical protein